MDKYFAFLIALFIGFVGIEHIVDQFTNSPAEQCHEACGMQGMQSYNVNPDGSSVCLCQDD